MLISLSHRFIFLANLKTGSTAIETALRPYSEICLDRSEWGKHVSLSHAELRMARVFEMVPRAEFRVLAVIREPLDWLGSLYRSHKSVQFEGTPLDTSAISMENFLTRWRIDHADQCVPQIETFFDIYDRFGVDYLMRYDRLDEDFDDAMSTLGVPKVILTQENVSVDIADGEAVPEALQSAIHKSYAADFDAWQRLSGRFLTPEEKASATRDSHNVPEKGTISIQEIALGALRVRKITRDDVFWAFRMLLGRDPESEDVIQEHLSLGTREALRERIIGSEEFKIMTSGFNA